MLTFPFGAPIERLGVELPTQRVRAFVLGAYPSAMHAEWRTPAGDRVAALPVDNEPVPFWDGSGKEERFETWRTRYFKPKWGSVSPSPLNGSSGWKLYDAWLGPLGIERGDYFVTDCLDTAMMSDGVEQRVTAAGGDRATYFNLIDDLGLPHVAMPSHPSEAAIVRLAGGHHDRLHRQIAASGAPMLVTLGNAAARVMAQLGEQQGGKLIKKSYGVRRRLVVEGKEYDWFALVHPAVRAPWTDVHAAWRESCAAGRAGRGGA